MQVFLFFYNVYLDVIEEKEKDLPVSRGNAFHHSLKV